MAGFDTDVDDDVVVVMQNCTSWFQPSQSTHPVPKLTVTSSHGCLAPMLAGLTATLMSSVGSQVKFHGAGSELGISDSDGCDNASRDLT